MAAKRSRGPLPSIAPSTIEIRNAIALVTLNRPEVHNAFDETLIAELTQALRALGADDTVRVVVSMGAGTSFCAGADLNWMKKMARFSKARISPTPKRLRPCCRRSTTLPKPTVARVHGAAFGGGVGLVACCDIAIGAQDATFAFSESKLGLIPATISPYVIEADRRARGATLFPERRALLRRQKRFGWVCLHDLAQASELDDRIDELLGFLVTAGPRAQAECKALIRAVAHRPIDPAVIARHRHAALRGYALPPEAKEGVAAFLDKRRAAWVPRGD